MGQRQKTGRRVKWAAARKERRKRREGGVLFVFFQTFSNSYFKLLKLNSFQNTPRFSKHF
jgi:hypothetical protein